MTGAFHTIGLFFFLEMLEITLIRATGAGEPDLALPRVPLSPPHA